MSVTLHLSVHDVPYLCDLLGSRPYIPGEDISQGTRFALLSCDNVKDPGSGTVSSSDAVNPRHARLSCSDIFMSATRVEAILRLLLRWDGREQVKSRRMSPVYELIDSVFVEGAHQHMTRQSV